MTGVDLRFAGAAPAIRAALAWWAEGLEAALPACLVGLAAGDRRWVSIAADEEGRSIARLMASHSATKPLAEARLDASDNTSRLRPILAAARSRPIVLQAPIAQSLTQTVRVPAAALENLTEAVRFGLATWTPFTAEDVVLHARVLDRSDDHARIAIRMIPRVALARFTDRAAQAGLDVSHVAFGQDVVKYGDAGDAIARRIARCNRIDLILAICAVTLAAGLLATLHVGWARELDSLQDAIRAAAAHRAKQAGLESEIAQMETRRRAVLDKRSAEPHVSEVIADVAGRLPEAAEVLDFEWVGGQGRLRVSANPDADVAAAFQSSSVVVLKRERDDGDGDGVQLFGLTAKAAK